MHGVVLEKIDASKHAEVMQQYDRGGKLHGRSYADISRRTKDARDAMARGSFSDSRYFTSNGNFGYDGLVAKQSRGDTGRNNEGESSPNQTVPDLANSSLGNSEQGDVKYKLPADGVNQVAKDTLSRYKEALRDQKNDTRIMEQEFARIARVFETQARRSGKKDVEISELKEALRRNIEH